MRIAYLTAGAAGMYCGSCMHDNALARALIARGADCLLLPVYTPIRTDERDVSADRVFFGGINVFLQQKAPWLGRLPGPLQRFLDAPWLLRLATRRAAATSPAMLGELTVSMLRGSEGHQAGEVQRLVRWLTDEFRPDAIVLSNLLIAGCVPAIRRAMDVPIVSWLQGDDIFIEYLTEPHKTQALELLAEVAAATDACLTNSRFYAQKMQGLLKLSDDRMRLVPLAIDVAPFAAAPSAVAPSAVAPSAVAAPSPLPTIAHEGSEFPAGSRQVEESDPAFRIGYLARLAPEKGFHHLVEAFIEFAKRPGGQRAELHYAGWLGNQHRAYFRAAQHRLDAAGLGDRHHYHGSPSLEEKLSFLRHNHVLCVPTVYEEPKGLFVLEALAAGVPVIQPNHGAFPELLASTGGGLLVPPGDLLALADAFESLSADRPHCTALGRTGCQNVHRNHTIEAQAERVERILQSLRSPRALHPPPGRVGL
ncbi:glycosyltransferase family 4 protein [Candidatus Laterigemmans baculatus]|uniref:glycosyltransferase family 4 protein n=1 Tax=Candidatus Laterigemmans baculatus TaxID=2770505 RepID=UPI0013D966A6|nr:glycosyltransferase family 4 protein [Candidatus Laterigemmans baculatus]